MKAYTIDITGIQEQPEAKKVTAAEKKARAKRMSTVKRMKREESAQASEEKPTEKLGQRDETAKESVHWPKRGSKEQRTVRPEGKEGRVPVAMQHPRPEETRREPESPEKATETQGETKPLSDTLEAEPAEAEQERYDEPGWQEIERTKKPVKRRAARLTEEKKPKAPVVKEAAPVEPEQLAETMPEELYYPTSELCINCDIVSKAYKNPANQILRTVPKEEPMGGELSEYSPVDGLCVGCGLSTFFKVNPIREIICELTSKHGEVVSKPKEEEAPSIMDELCPGCDILSNIIKGLSASHLSATYHHEDIHGDIYEVPDGKVVSIVSDNQEEETPGPMVIDMPSSGAALVVRDSESESPDIKVIDDSDAESEQVADILTPASNSMPTVQEYLTAIESTEEKQQKSEKTLEAEETGLPIYVRRDIEIKVLFDGPDEGVIFMFTQKSHPMEAISDNETDITETLDEIIFSEGSGLRRIFSLARAGKGVYSFIVESKKSDIDRMDIRFLLHKGLDSERLKEYESIKVRAGGRRIFKVLMPEAVFWDDEDYFTGAVEGASFTTKFNDDTGLIWKEKTEQ